jgi:hypothetical protein
MRNGSLFMILAIGCVALAGCGDAPTAIGNIDDGLLAPPCLSENRGTFVLHNGKDAVLNVLIDDRMTGSIDPQEDLGIDVSAGVEHEVRFHWTNGSIACFASYHTVQACESVTISCN